MSKQAGIGGHDTDRVRGGRTAKANGEPIEEKIARLTAELEAEFDEGRRLEARIRDNLRRLDYGGPSGGAS